MINIALDGPAGAGKSWLARALAESLGYIHVDTGALYRSIGLYMLRKDISADDKNGITAVLPDLTVALAFEGDGQHVYLCGEDVTGLIRTPEVSAYAAAVSAIPEVREFLLEMQRKLARENNVIMDGRDIGTVILPDADVKLFVTADDEVRADRRMKELRQRGIDQPFEDVLREIRERDRMDSTREVSPASAAEDAIVLNNSKLDREETLAEALRIIREHIG